jgi:hypothetical protein
MMTSLPATVFHEELTIIEKETIEAFIVREGTYILEEELDYYFANKAKMLEPLVHSINFSKISSAVLQEKINQVLVSTHDLEMILAKIQRRIVRELDRANCRHAFCLNIAGLDQALPRFESDISEQQRTLKLSRTIARGIDMAWRKAGSSFLPKNMTRVTNKLQVGNYLISVFAVSPSQQETEMKAACLKAAKATLKQFQAELYNILVKQMVGQLFTLQGYYEPEPEMTLVKLHSNITKHLN